MAGLVGLERGPEPDSRYTTATHDWRRGARLSRDKTKEVIYSVPQQIEIRGQLLPSVGWLMDVLGNTPQSSHGAFLACHRELFFSAPMLHSSKHQKVRNPTEQHIPENVSRYINRL